MCGKRPGREGAEIPVLVWEKDPQIVLNVRIGQGDADIAVEESQAVIVFCDHDETAGIPGTMAPDRPSFLQDLLDQGIQGGNPIGTFNFITNTLKSLDDVKDVKIDSETRRISVEVEHPSLCENDLT